MAHLSALTALSGSITAHSTRSLTNANGNAVPLDPFRKMISTPTDSRLGSWRNESQHAFQISKVDVAKGRPLRGRESGVEGEKGVGAAEVEGVEIEEVLAGGGGCMRVVACVLPSRMRRFHIGASAMH
ncbi:hypothetical protein B0J11DRAFT_509275 [Dendryphion nanum]|uniref:Uncharacterized protein n=1 Tax=Dendryphion nanum TaxID=256645 RepID=A0A9P9DEA3_9PLEO|nr:hypothetical protein B0J11DRAFT_509275 [Dendryphion nanum]